jgi:hypothetical protein
MSSDAAIEAKSTELRRAAERTLRSRINSWTRIGGGRNSLVFRLRTADGRTFALKSYFRHRGDKRDRLGTEFNCLRLLHDHGFTNVPRPMAASRRHGFALYEFIVGSKPNLPSAEDIAAVVDLLDRLRQLSMSPDLPKISPASEACFSPRAIVEVLHRRLDRLSGSQGSARNLAALRRYLNEEFSPALKRFTAWSRSHLRRGGIDFDRELPVSERTLSPSDFGFYNALQRRGNLVFLDFEYFGWDDPAKMIVDFLLHPARPVPARLKRRFLTEMLDRFSDWQKLQRRVEAVYPLFGLKWCLILLNEFLPADYQRRQFAQAAAGDRDAAQRRQLNRSRRLLRRLLRQPSPSLV